MPTKKRAQKKVAPKIETPSLADQILNGNPVAETEIPEAIEPEIIEPIQVVADEPEVAKIPVVNAKPYQQIKTEGTRFYSKEMANLTPHGSVGPVGHDLIWSVKFDEHGMSEFVTDPKVIEKLLKMGWKEFKA